MKITRFGFFVVCVFIFCRAASWGFYHKFGQEPFLGLEAADTYGKGNYRFNIQHHYDEYGVASANLRFGYGFAGHSDVFVSALFHSNNLIVAKTSIKEYQIENKVSILREGKNSRLGLSIWLGLSSYSFDYETGGKEYPDRRNYYFTSILLSKNLSRYFLISLSPALIYDNKDMAAITGIFAGTRFNYNDKIALFAEYPLQLQKPAGWKQPWAVGFQFHLSPHILTLFYTNYYGFTASNLLQGLDKNFFGFRFSF